MSDAEMLKVAQSHSVDRVREFLQQYPEKLNHMFSERERVREFEFFVEWTLLGYASREGDFDIVSYLLSMADIDLRAGVSVVRFRFRTPLDLALEGKHTQCVHALVTRGAPLRERNQHELNEFLRDHPVVAPQPQPPSVDKTQWIPQGVRERMTGGTLLQMGASEIKQNICQGTLPCGWLPDGKWPDIHQRAKEHENTRHDQQQHLNVLKQERQDLDQRRQQLEKELADIKQRAEALDQRIQQEEKNPPPPMIDLSSLLEFAARVIPIEQALVGQLETELKKKKPQLAALEDDTSAQPKLSLMLNCMGVNATGINATSSMDLTQFLRKTSRGSVFSASIPSYVKRETVLDLMYCAELVRANQFPFVGHEDECTVCGNQTAEELINFLKERGIKLDEKVLRRKNINGRRVLYCTKEDFPDQPEEEVAKAVDALQTLHDDHFD